MNVRKAVAAVVLGLGIVGGAVACGGGGGGGGAQSAASKGDVKPIGEAKVGDRTKCPVSGEEFTVSDSSPKVEHEGKTYFFCCSGCDQKFKADPKKYLGAPAS
jgi:YHS domain-containing protein